MADNTPDWVVANDGTTATLRCGCGQQYEISSDTPGWASPWILCPECALRT